MNVFQKISFSTLMALLLLAHSMPESCAEPLGFIDKRGKLVLNLSQMQASVLQTITADTRGVASLVRDFSEGYCVVCSYEGTCRFLSASGKFLPGEFEDAKPFSNGLAAIRKSGLWGFINTKGEMCISPKFLDVMPFSEDRAAVWNGHL